MKKNLTEMPLMPKRGHLPALDGVRGLAILMVLGAHMFSSNSAANGRVATFLGDLLNYGFFGVDLFFVLSGFLITGVLVDSLDDSGYFSKFYSRRALRIFPLYYGVLLVLLVLTPVLHFHWEGMGWLLGLYLQNLRPEQLTGFQPGPGTNLTHFWSLAIEEQFYFVWPAVVFFVRDRRKLLTVTLAVSASALVLRLLLLGAGVSDNLIRMSTFTRADTLLLGGALALLYRSELWPRVLRLAPYGFWAALLVILGSIKLFGREFFPLAPYPRTMEFWIYGPRYTLLALASACLLACALTPVSTCKRLFEAPVMRFFGRYSYGIYVLHAVLLPLLLGTQRAAIVHLTHSKLLGVFGAGISTLALSIVAAYLSFHLYEKPFLRLKQYVAYAPKRAERRSVEEVPVGRPALDLVDSKSYIHEVSLL